MAKAEVEQIPMDWNELSCAINAMTNEQRATNVMLCDAVNGESFPIVGLAVAGKLYEYNGVLDRGQPYLIAPCYGPAVLAETKEK